MPEKGFAFPHRWLAGSGGFVIMLIVAAICTYVPYLGLPFKWLESYFHELSHAIATFASGGQVSHIELDFNGAGRCISRGGNEVVIGFCGYAGAAVWGLVLYACASWPRGSRLAYGLVGTLVLLSMLLLASNVSTLVIMLVLVALFFLPLKFAHLRAQMYLLRFIALIVLLNAIKSLTYIFAFHQQGDLGLLQRFSVLPSWIWLAAWLLIGLSCLWCCYRLASLEDARRRQ